MSHLMRSRSGMTWIWQSIGSGKRLFNVLAIHNHTTTTLPHTTMTWSKRTLAYVEPKGHSVDLLKSIQRTDTHVTLDTSDKVCNYAATQVKYTIDDFTEVISDKLLVQLLEGVQIFQMTMKKNDIAFKHEADKAGYLNEWYSWMHPGITLKVAPQDVSSWREYYDLSVFTRDFLLGEQLRVKVSDLPDMVFEKEWWSWSQLTRDTENEFNDGVKRLLHVFGIVDYSEDNYDAIEILLNKKKMSVYLYNYYESGSDFTIDIDPPFDNHEFALVSEMSTIEETRDVDLRNGETVPCRFFSGIRGASTSQAFQPTMFLHTPSQYVLPYTNFTMSIDQSANAWMHPMLDFKVEMGDEYENGGYLPRDVEILNADKCELHVEVEFSNEYIVDRYEINRLIERGAKNGGSTCIRKLKSMSNNGMDLELPAYKVDEWGSFIDVIIDPDCVFKENASSFSIPLHLRYPEPTAGGLAELETPWSKVYWKCPLDKTGVHGVNGSFYFEPDRFSADTSLPTVREYLYPPLSVSSSELGVEMPRGDGRLRAEVEGATGIVVAVASVLLAAVAIFKH